MKYPKPTLLAATAALCVVCSAPVFAQFGGSAGDSRGRTAPRAAPGPVAGVGLPFLISAGAYWMVRRRTKSARPRSSVEQV